MTLVRILPDKYFSVSRVLPHKHVVVTGYEMEKPRGSTQQLNVER